MKQTKRVYRHPISGKFVPAEEGREQEVIVKRHRAPKQQPVPRKKQRTYVLKQDIVIPAGTIFSSGPHRRSYGSPHYEAIIGFGRDYAGDFTLDEELIERHPDLFMKNDGNA